MKQCTFTKNRNLYAGKWWRKAYQQFYSMKQHGILDPSDEEVLVFSKTQTEKYGASG